jgi:Arc/MetJ family transcription regulator
LILQVPQERAAVHDAIDAALKKRIRQYLEQCSR